MNRRMFVASIVTAAAQAQDSVLGGPVLGYTLDAEGRVRPLLGPAGSAYLAQAMVGSSGLRTWAGSYGLDAEGFVHYGVGAQELRRLADAGGGWQNLVSSAKPEVALVQNGSRVARLRGGAADDAVELAFSAARLALGGDGERIVAADGDHCAGWSVDGRQLFQYPIADVRALLVLPGNAGFCGLADTLFRVDDTGRREDYGPVAGTAMVSTADGAIAVILDTDGMAVRTLSFATRTWQTWELPLAARQLLPLRDGRTFVVFGDVDEPIWTLALQGAEARWAQVPMAMGGRK